VALLLVATLLTAVSGAASLATSVSSRRNLRAGRASYDDIADYTGIAERRVLAQLPGTVVEPDGSFRVDPYHLERLPRTRAARVLGSPVGDAVSIAVAIVALALGLLRGRDTAWVALAPAGVYQAAGWTWAVAVGLRHRADVVGERPARSGGDTPLRTWPATSTR
jgi:predicted anti-sigma-YlaC factor YlaD